MGIASASQDIVSGGQLLLEVSAAPPGTTDPYGNVASYLEGAVNTANFVLGPNSIFQWQGVLNWDHVAGWATTLTDAVHVGYIGEIDNGEALGRHAPSDQVHLDPSGPPSPAPASGITNSPAVYMTSYSGGVVIDPTQVNTYTALYNANGTVTFYVTPTYGPGAGQTYLAGTSGGFAFNPSDPRSTLALFFSTETEPKFNTGDFDGDANGITTTANVMKADGDTTPQARDYAMAVNWARVYTVQPALPAGWTDLDIGAPPIAGSASYNASTGLWTVAGSGQDIYNNADQFNFASQSFNGDGTLIAEVNSVTNTYSWAKSGLMFRASNAAGAQFVDVLITPKEGVAFQWRSTTNGSCAMTVVAGVAAPSWIQLTRTGNSFSAFYSVDGVTWKQIGTSQTIAMPTAALAGLAVTSVNLSALNTTTFSNLSFSNSAPTIVTPAAANPNPTTGLTTGLSVLGTDAAGNSSDVHLVHSRHRAWNRRLQQQDQCRQTDHRHLHRGWNLCGASDRDRSLGIERCQSSHSHRQQQHTHRADRDGQPRQHHLRHGIGQQPVKRHRQRDREWEPGQRAGRVHLYQRRRHLAQCWKRPERSGDLHAYRHD